MAEDKTTSGISGSGESKSANPAGASREPGIVPISEGTPEQRAGVPDPEGQVSNVEPAGGTVQTEPKPEEYPASVKVTPPLEQVNSRAARAIEDTIVYADNLPGMPDALAEGQKRWEENQRTIGDEVANIVEERRDMDRRIDELATGGKEGAAARDAVRKQEEDAREKERKEREASKPKS